MDKNFARDIDYIRKISRESYMLYNHDIFTKWIAKNKIDLSGNVLDIGERNPLFDMYRFRKLVERAGFEIVSFDHYHRYNHVNLKSFTGIRPFLYMFYKQHGIFKIKKQP